MHAHSCATPCNERSPRVEWAITATTHCNAMQRALAVGGTYEYECSLMNKNAHSWICMGRTVDMTNVDVGLYKGYWYLLWSNSVSDMCSEIIYQINLSTNGGTTVIVSYIRQNTWMWCVVVLAAWLRMLRDTNARRMHAGRFVRRCTHRSTEHRWSEDMVFKVCVQKIYRPQPKKHKNWRIGISSCLCCGKVHV